jgi:hypothetical protein
VNTLALSAIRSTPLTKSVIRSAWISRIGGVEDEAVGAVATAQLVRAVAATERIVTGPTGDRIVTTATAERVVAVAARDLVVAGAAIEQVGTGVARQRIVAQTTAQGVIAGGAAERVVAGATGDAVVAVGITAQPVVAAGSLEQLAENLRLRQDAAVAEEANLVNGAADIDQVVAEEIIDDEVIDDCGTICSGSDRDHQVVVAVRVARQRGFAGAEIADRAGQFDRVERPGEGVVLVDDVVVAADRELVGVAAGTAIEECRCRRRR